MDPTTITWRNAWVGLKWRPKSEFLATFLYLFSCKVVYVAHQPFEPQDPLKGFVFRF